MVSFEHYNYCSESFLQKIVLETFSWIKRKILAMESFLGISTNFQKSKILSKIYDETFATIINGLRAVR